MENKTLNKMNVIPAVLGLLFPETLSNANSGAKSRTSHFLAFLKYPDLSKSTEMSFQPHVFYLVLTPGGPVDDNVSLNLRKVISQPLPR